MARKPNYDFEKRRKEQERKSKKEEKLRRRRENAANDEFPEGSEAAVGEEGSAQGDGVAGEVESTR